MKTVRVVVAGDRPSLRSVAESAGFVLAGEADDFLSAIEVFDNSGADVILLDGIPETTPVPGIPTIAMTIEDPIDPSIVGGCFVVPADASVAFLRASVASVLAWSHALRVAEDRGEALAEEIETRKLVERAKGILMQRLHLSEQDAYRRLQRASQNENRKMRDVADSIVRTEKILSDNAPQRANRAARSGFSG